MWPLFSGAAESDNYKIIASCWVAPLFSRTNSVASNPFASGKCGFRSSKCNPRRSLGMEVEHFRFHFFVFRIFLHFNFPHTQLSYPFSTWTNFFFFLAFIRRMIKIDGHTCSQLFFYITIFLFFCYFVFHTRNNLFHFPLESNILLLLFSFEVWYRLMDTQAVKCYFFVHVTIFICSGEAFG